MCWSLYGRPATQMALILTEAGFDKTSKDHTLFWIQRYYCLIWGKENLITFKYFNNRDLVFWKMRAANFSLISLLSFQLNELQWFLFS